MTPRIRPADLEHSPYKDLVDSLSHQWMRAGLPAPELLSAEYSRAIRALLLTTQNLERTTVLFQAVLAQAVLLGKASAWVVQELKFEGMLEGADRADFLRFELEQADSLTDAFLDLYNERMSRFGSSGPAK